MNFERNNLFIFINYINFSTVQRLELPCGKHVRTEQDRQRHDRPSGSSTDRERRPAESHTQNGRRARDNDQSSFFDTGIVKKPKNNHDGHVGGFNLNIILCN